MSTLLLSDLHLPTDASPLRDGFVKFLAGPARNADAVYLLGDLFEVWIGDERGLHDYAPETAALKALSDSVPVFFMHGNRDFMLGADYAAATGMQLLHDPTTVDFYGTPTLLAHGDRYCTDDVSYQRWRRFSRQSLIQAGYRALPESLRGKIAGGIRSTSRVQKQRMAEDIMDVNPSAIVAALTDTPAARMIHGHTHRPAEYRLTVKGHDCERIVLADWRPDRMEYLELTAQGYLRRLI